MRLRWEPLFLVLAAATLVAVAAVNLDPVLATGMTRLIVAPLAQNTGPTPPFVTGCRLVDPPVLAPPDLNRPGPHVLNAEITAQPATLALSGSQVSSHVYDAGSVVPTEPRCARAGRAWLPPTLRVDPGDTVNLQFSNRQVDTEWHTNLHFHGLHVSPGADPNDPTRPSDDTFLDVAPANLPDGISDQRYRLDIPKDHPVGTYWYHGHFHPEEPQVSSGEAGLIQVGDLNALLPPPLHAIRTHSLMLSDLQFLPGTATVDTDNIDSNAPTTRLVNGMLLPYMTMAVNETQHWRLANTGANVFYDVQFDGHPFFVIGEDGNPAYSVRMVTHLLMPPASRFDVLVQSTGRERVGSSFTLRTLEYRQGSPPGDRYPNVALATVRFTAPVRRTPDALPASMPGAAPLPPDDVTDRRTIYFNEDPNTNTFAINSAPEVVQTEIPLAPVVVPPGRDSASGEWTIVNTAFEVHPFHVHVNPFQVIAVSDPDDSCPNALKPIDPGVLQDTMPLPQRRDTSVPIQCPGESEPTTKHYGRVVLRTTWRDFFGRYVGDPQGQVMLHCHIAAHFDTGMLTWFEVIKQ